MKRDDLFAPVHPLPDRDYRLAWARDLSLDNAMPLDVNWAKADRLLKLPLFEVLIWGGLDGVERAEQIARQRMAA